jgi:uncharacterized protein with PIN domain
MPRQLITLEDHNAAILTSVADPMLNESRPNGIACPKCSAELLDVTPGMVCAFAPLRKSVRCDKCGFLGDRLC